MMRGAGRGGEFPPSCIRALRPRPRPGGFSRLSTPWATPAAQLPQEPRRSRCLSSPLGPGRRGPEDPLPPASLPLPSAGLAEDRSQLPVTCAKICMLPRALYHGVLLFRNVRHTCFC